MFHRISGPTAISGAVDSSFTLVEERRGSGRAKLTCIGRDIENPGGGTGGNARKAGGVVSPHRAQPGGLGGGGFFRCVPPGPRRGRAWRSYSGACGYWRPPVLETGRLPLQGGPIRYVMTGADGLSFSRWSRERCIQRNCSRFPVERGKSATNCEDIRVPDMN